MITLQGMRIIQKGYILYLTSATVEELNNWNDVDRIVPDIWKREKQDGYQRLPNMQRAMKIARYVEGRENIEETLLPTSIILNIRQTGAIEFNKFKDSDSQKTRESGTILIHDEALPFFEVDGQHRIRGLIEAYKELKQKKSENFEEIKYYPIPLTIMEGLDRPKEAIQFAVINTQQKSIDPALVLRILYKRYRDKSQQLDFFLKGGKWRFWAVEVCDQLNSDYNSPWSDKIVAPGEDRKGKVISQQNFINSLETVYRRLDDGIIKQYLPLYWKAIKNLWPECVGENASNYSLQRTNGINTFHWLFPYIYFKCFSLGNVKIPELAKCLKPINKKFDASFWERGGKAKGFTSRASQGGLVDEMIATTLPGGILKLSKMDARIKGTKEEKNWIIAKNLIPLRSYFLFNNEEVDRIQPGATGVYVIYSFTKQRFYVGRSHQQDLKSRLHNHLQNKSNEFHIFNSRLCKEPKQAHDLECALYHLLPENLKINKEHPSAFEGKECPFCLVR